MAETLIVKWTWRYHSLECDDYFDTYEQAASAALYASDAGDEALDCIEVWDESGYRKYSADEVFAFAEARRPVWVPGPPAVAVVEILAPNNPDRWVNYEGFTDEDDAHVKALELRERLADRVRVRALTPR